MSKNIHSFRYRLRIAGLYLGLFIHLAYPLTGTVRDTANRPIPYANVRLIPSLLSATSDTFGNFDFSTSRNIQRLDRSLNPKFSLTKDALYLRDLDEYARITADVFNLSGRLIYRITPTRFLESVRIPLKTGDPSHRPSDGVTLLVVKAGPSTLRVLYIGGMHAFYSSTNVAVSSLTNAGVAKVSAAGIDSLVITHIRYQTIRKELASLSDNVNIVMTLKSSPYLKLPDTRQINSYTSTSGEDADYLSTPPSYTNNGDGTVTDNITGLVWQHDESGEMTFDSAKTYCASLVLGGHARWRLPSSHEIFNIHDFDTFNPALDTTLFHFSGAEYWWSQNKGIEKNGSVWVTNKGGGIGAHLATETQSAGGTRTICTRCVSGDSIPANLLHDLIDNSNNTVTDKTFGLMWQQSEAGVMNWEQALIYADTLTLGGFTDWRLPNIKELRSLNDDRICNPSVDTTFFPLAVSMPYWSSTTQMHSPTTSWMVDFKSGLVTYKEKTLVCNVRCVRGGL